MLDYNVQQDKSNQKYIIEIVFDYIPFNIT